MRGSVRLRREVSYCVALKVQALCSMLYSYESCEL
jgi:hypothetical protein